MRVRSVIIETALLITVFSLESSIYETQGPTFNVEPLGKVILTNTEGGRVDCAARGNPAPRIQWTGTDTSQVHNIPGIRTILSNGSLYFSPFKADAFRQDVHWAVYRCVLTNSVGSIVSRDVVLRAVVDQQYEPEIKTTIAYSGNNVLLRCVVPAYVKDHVTVTSWLQEPSYNIYPSTTGDGKYHMLPGSGELMIINVTKADTERRFRCRTHHSLIQEAVVSSKSGQIRLTEIIGPVAPVLYEKLVPASARLDESVVIPCVAHGNPRPLYRWFRRNGLHESTTIEGGDRYVVRDGTLVVQSVKESDAGIYYCNATNTEGYEIMEVQLHVTAPLSVRIHPARQTVDVGKQTELYCRISGFPHTSIYWLKDGHALRTNSRIKLPAKDKLQILSMNKEDKGMYQCFVKNEKEMVQGAAEIRLGDAAPQLLYKFIEQTMQPGPSVSLKCSATGNPTPQITWLLDGFPIAHSDRLMIGQYVTVYGDVISHVNITSVKSIDGGDYQCVAENRAGKVSHSARLNIYGLPFVRPIPNIPAIAGKELVVKCPIAGYPIETILWEKDNLRLPSNARQKVLNGGWVLKIEHVQKNVDQGTYSCLARNKHNHTSQRSFQIQVLVPPRTSPFYFEDGVTEGMRTQVMCSSSQGDQPFNISWYKDDKLIDKNTALEGNWISITDYAAFSSILTITSVTPSHTGNYKCVISNRAGTAQHTASLYVTVPPWWVVEPGDQNVVLGNPATLTCQVDGFPKPTIVWKQAVGDESGEYREIKSNTKGIENYENGTLFIPRATEDLEGFYLCQATNKIGPGLSKLIKFTVYVGPKFKPRSQQETAWKGKVVHLRCEAEGDLPMDVSWTTKGQLVDLSFIRYSVKNSQLENGIISELTIEQVSPRDRGQFMCIAKNAYGQETSITELLVQEPPGFPRNLQIAKQTSRSLYLTWSSPSGSEDLVTPVSTYILQYKEARDVWHDHNPRKVMQGDQTHVLVSGLRPATHYHVRLYAENQLGTSQPSDVLHGVTEAEIPAGPPVHVSVEAVSSTQLRVSWQTPDRELWNGELTGYNIGYKKGSVGDSEPYMWNKMSTAGETHCEYRLTALQKYTEYSVVVAAVNIKGAGPNSELVVAHTLEDVPDAAPDNIMCKSLGPDKLQITWQAPPPNHLNGVVQGYKVFYEPSDEVFEYRMQERKLKDTHVVILDHLKPYTNYTVQVMAFTRPGDGVISPEYYCRTEETLPQAPERIKAVVSSEDIVTISWLPPKQPNGVITKYTVFVRVLEQGQETKIIKGSLPPQLQYYEAVGLKQRETYEAWVAASTKIGQGQSTPTIKLNVNSVVPAAIVSFGYVVVVPWKQDVKLPCMAVGKPAPDVEWKLGDIKVKNFPRMEVKTDNMLVIQNVQRANEGNYSCTVTNHLGNDQIIYPLHVQVPPTSPLLLTTSTTASSIQLQWKQGDNGGAVVRGFLLLYRMEHGKWEEIRIDRRITTYLLEGLLCGMRYEFRLSAYNKIGVGTPSNVESARTKGGKPIPPMADKILEINATSVTLNLASWSDGGCPLSHFTVEYKSSDIWVLASNSVMPHLKFSIVELRPSTKYVVKVTGLNSAGRTSSQYDVTTLPGVDSGGHIIHQSPDQENKNYIPFYLNAQIVATCAFSFLLVMVVVGGLCICFQKRETILRHRPNREQQQTSTSLVGEYTNQHDRDDYCTTVHKPRQSPCRDAAALERIPEYSEDIYPYATFHLPELVGPSINPLRRQLYTYSNSSADSINMVKIESEKYPKVQRMRKTRAVKSESEEYDSDSEAEVGTSRRAVSSNQLEVGVHIPPTRDNSLCHRHGSNTLAALSLTSECKTKRYRHGEKLGWFLKLRSNCPKHKHQTNWGQRNEGDCCIDPIGTLHSHRNMNLLNIFNPKTNNQEDYTIAV